MITTLLVVSLLALVIGIAVIRPLIHTDQEVLAADVSEDEAQFHELVALRDALVSRLVGGHPGVGSSSAHPSAVAPGAQNGTSVADLSDNEALEALIRVCSILRRLGLRYLPGVGATLTLFVIALAGAALPLLTPATARAQPLESSAGAGGAAETPSSPSSDRMAQSLPGPLGLPDGTAMSQVNQFVLSPDQGQLRVYYLALVSVPEAQRLRLRIPSPDGASGFDFSSLTEATIEPDRAGQPPVLDMPLQAGVNQIQGMFLISAATGSLEWSSSFLQTLPGVTLIILPEYHDVLTVLLGDLPQVFGLWPPRIVEPPADFEFKRTLEQPNERDPNFARMKNPPDQYSYHLFRRGDTESPYPRFSVRGLMPSRTAGYLVVVTFAILLLSIMAFRVRSLASRKSP